jgi:hypothetical protein
MKAMLSLSISRPIKAVFEKFGYLIQKSTPVDELMNLIDFLKPKATDIPLIRIGEIGDGGYLIPNDLVGIDFCLSPGSNKEWNFEKNLFDTYNIRSAIIDTLEKKPLDLYPQIQYTDSWLGVTNSRNFISMDSWMNKINLKPGSDLLLQMDIEGAEYDILAALPTEILDRFRIIVVEFHYSYRLLNRDLFSEHYSKVFKRLKENHIVVHFHANNSCGDWVFRKQSLPIVFEITLIRKDRIKQVLGQSPVPHELDSDCVAQLPTSKFKFK